MAAATSKARCVTCGKQKVAHPCAGCSQNFCFNHLADHHRALEKQLDEVEDRRNFVRETLTQQKNNPQEHPLIQQINIWEHHAINKIRQTAEEARQMLIQHTTEHSNNIENKLAKLTEQLKQTRDKDDVNEIVLNQFIQKLKQLEKELAKPSHISIREESSSFISKISVTISPELISIPINNNNAKWTQNGITVAGGNSSGNAINQLSNPHGVFVDDDDTVYVADYCNHRIVEWKRGAIVGEVVAGGNGYGNQNNQLNRPTSVIVNKKGDCLIISDLGNKRVVLWPRRNGTSGQTIISNVDCIGLSIDNDEYIYVADIYKHEVRRWKIGDTNGTLVAGGNGAGNRLDQLNGPYYIFVDQDQSVYVSDYNNHRVMKWMKDAKEGIVVAGGQVQGNGLTQLSNPRGVIVDQLGTVYVVDYNNYRIMRYLKGATEGSIVVGGNGGGVQGNQFNIPLNLSFDRQNNLYVVDYSNNRIQKFDIERNSN